MKILRNIHHGNGLLVLILLFSFFVGIFKLSSSNLYYDELGMITAARIFLKENVSPWFYTMAQPPPLSVWLTSASFSILGVNIFAMRAVEIFFGMLTILMVYFLANLLYSKKAAIIAALLIAVSPLQVTSSRTGFIDVMVTFFTLLSLFVLEYNFKKNFTGKKRMFFLIMAGTAFGLAFLTKMNSVILWTVYWLFIFLRCFAHFRNKAKFKNSIKAFFSGILAVNTVAFMVVLLSTGFKPSNIFFLIYGFVYMLIAHNTVGYVPFYYPYIILINALSPLIYISFIVSIAYFLHLVYKNRSRNDMLLLFLTAVFFILAAMQKRIASRHLVLVLPFIFILISKFLTDIISFKILRKFRYLAASLIFILVFSSFLSSVKDIKREINYRIWDDVADFINREVPDDVAIYPIFPYWPLAHRMANYTYYTYNINKKAMQLDINNIKTGDYFILGNFSGKFDIVRHEPITGDIGFFGLNLFREEKIEPYPLTAAFIKKNAKLVKTFHCGSGACLFVYRLEKFNKNEIPDEKWDIFGSTGSRERFFEFSCYQWRNNKMFGQLKKLMGRHVMDSAERKCSSFV